MQSASKDDYFLAKIIRLNLKKAISHTAVWQPRPFLKRKRGRNRAKRGGSIFLLSLQIDLLPASEEREKTSETNPLG